MRRPAKKASREAREAQRIERTRALLAQPGFMEFLLDVFDYLEPSAIFSQHSQHMANLATKQDAANWIKGRLRVADPNALWILERERMRRRMADVGSSDERDDRDEFPGSGSDGDVGGGRDE